MNLLYFLRNKLYRPTPLTRREFYSGCLVYYIYVLIAALFAPVWLEIRSDFFHLVFPLLLIYTYLPIIFRFDLLLLNYKWHKDYMEVVEGKALDTTKIGIGQYYVAMISTITFVVLCPLLFYNSLQYALKMHVVSEIKSILVYGCFA